MHSDNSTDHYHAATRTCPNSTIVPHRYISDLFLYLYSPTKIYQTYKDVLLICNPYKNISSNMCIHRINANIKYLRWSFWRCRMALLILHCSKKSFVLFNWNSNKTTERTRYGHVPILWDCRFLENWHLWNRRLCHCTLFLWKLGNVINRYIIASDLDGLNVNHQMSVATFDDNSRFLWIKTSWTEQCAAEQIGASLSTFNS